ncbi:MAG TPA: hypothetical protein VFU71_02705, partial [Burkholderiaceae bacterium]|nr:hypothetical protein [Burkholderiaceae bacterium]
MVLEWLCIVLAAVAALMARPWRALPASGPPWVWLAVCSVVPALWSADRHAAALLQPWSGASLLVLLAGWPLATLAMMLVAVVLVA